jgi:NTP pyrophosphatase (non-canonical NTP hydrolase)
MNADSYAQMLEAVQRFHTKHRFKETGGEEMTYRISLMSEELGEISACVTKGKSKEELGEELADLLILVIGCGIARDIDLNAQFWAKMAKLDRRGSRMIDGRVRVSEFRDVD